MTTSKRRSAADGARDGLSAHGRFVAEIRGCRLCAERFAATRSAHAPRPVLQPGPDARVCVASQAPGVRAHKAGKPFEDPSGERLRRWMGVDRETFYDPQKIAILPMGFCFPGHDAKGGDLPPPKICAETWRARLFAAHPRLELVLLIGRYAQNWHLGAAGGGSLTETVARWERFLDPAEARDGPRFAPMPHPSWRNNAWLRKNRWFEAEALPRIQAEIAALLREER